MPHRPGHGTQRQRIERQARKQTALPQSKSSFEASRNVLRDAEDRRLNRLVNQNQGLKSLQSTDAQIIADMPAKFKDRFTNPDGSTKTYDQMNEADKTIFNFYDDGRNQYQRSINDFIQSSPESAAAYARRFPITNLIQKLTPAVVGSMVGVPLGVADAFDVARKGGRQVLDFFNIGNESGLGGVRSLLGNQGISRAQNEANMLDNTLATLNRQSELAAKPDDIFTPNVQTDFVSAQSSLANNPELQRIFGFPRGTVAQLYPEGTVGNYLVSDPGGLLSMANMPVSTTRGFAEGGIASLQDPNYNLLMEASDFSL